MTNEEYIKMIDETNKWYLEQNKKGFIRLFQGEDNEMTYRRPWIRSNWMHIMRGRLEKGRLLKPHQKAKIERMHHFGPVKWPQSRIQKRYKKLQEKKYGTASVH